MFGFFLEDGKEKELFEFLQEDLEKSTEHLTELLFRELDCISVPITSPADILHIKNYTKVTRKVRNNDEINEIETFFANILIINSFWKV